MDCAVRKGILTPRGRAQLGSGVSKTTSSTNARKRGRDRICRKPLLRWLRQAAAKMAPHSANVRTSAEMRNVLKLDLHQIAGGVARGLTIRGLEQKYGSRTN